jgi:hypothetical protein
MEHATDLPAKAFDRFDDQSARPLDSSAGRQAGLEQSVSDVVKSDQDVMGLAEKH